MTDTYDQLYENFLADQEIDDELSDTDELDEELLDEEDLVDGAEDNMPDANIIRQERVEPEIRIILIPNENSLPKPTDDSLRLADYFKLRSTEFHYGDVLHKIKNDGLEEPRLDMTKILSRWFPDKNVRWISLKCIGASNYCVSSNGQICHIMMKRLLETGNLRYAIVHIMFDNGIKTQMKVHNLVATAFWEFPVLCKMTVDHRNRSSRDNNFMNLSWETKETQALNRETRIYKPRIVNQIDPLDGSIIKEWSSNYEIAQYFNVRRDTINRIILMHQMFENSFWEYHEPLLPSEEFRPLLISGFDGFFISNKGRCMLRNGHITDGSVHYTGYRTVTLLNKLIGKKKCWLHILVAMTWIPNDQPLRNVINHKDHRCDNNVVENLEWATRSENSKHANILRRRVSYIDENGQRHEFSSMTEAANITKIHRSTITDECRKSQKGIVSRFSYIDDAVSVGNGLPVVQADIATGQLLFIWSSAYSAERHTGISAKSITPVVAGKRLSAGGFFWRRTTIFEAPQDITKIPDLSVLKSRGRNLLIGNVIEIYELNTVQVINTYKSINQAHVATGINVRIIRDLIKLRRNGYDKGDGIIRWYLCQSEYERRIKNNEPLIQPIKLCNDTNKPIVVMTLTGEYVMECPSLKATAAFIRSKVAYKSFSKSTIIEIAKGHANILCGYRFAFAEDYHRNPNSYKENLNADVLRAIKNSMG